MVRIRAIPSLQSPAKMSSVVPSLGRSALSVCLRLAVSGTVGVGHGCRSAVAPLKRLAPVEDAVWFGVAY
jgi:hypothetical protein